jgi:hypothetical protein
MSKEIRERQKRWYYEASKDRRSDAATGLLTAWWTADRLHRRMNKACDGMESRLPTALQVKIDELVGMADELQADIACTINDIHEYYDELEADDDPRTPGHPHALAQYISDVGWSK